MPSIEELQLLNYVISEKSLAPLEDLSEEHFLIHRETYLFIKQFAKEYGTTPTLETVLNRVALFEPVEAEDIRAVRKALREDLLHRQFKPTMVKAAELMGTKQTWEAIQYLLAESTSLLKLFGTTGAGYSYIREADNRLKSYQKIHGRDLTDILGTTTGFAPLDIATNGLEGGGEDPSATDYFLVFAPTNMGKTLLSSYMLQAGWSSSRNYDFPVYFALEQSAKEVAHNWDNVLGHVSRLALTRGTMAPEEYDRYIDFVDTLRGKTKDIMVYDMNSFGGRLPTVNDLRHVIESEGHTRFALDQLSKVTAPSHFGDLRQQLFGVSREVRAMILDTGVPGFIVAQATREVARRVKKDVSAEIEAEDIGEAYAIMQDASKCVAIVKVDDSTFRMQLVKNRGPSGKPFLIRYNFEAGLVHVLNDGIDEQYF